MRREEYEKLYPPLDLQKAIDENRKRNEELFGPLPPPIVRHPRSKRREATPVCIHRSEQVGYVDCSCQGKRSAYRCGKFVRPNVTPVEQAFCTEWLPSKRLKILALDNKTELAKIEYSELLGCNPLCEGYEPPPTEETPEATKPSSKILPCIYRGETQGSLDPGCCGAAATQLYRCTFHDSLCLEREMTRARGRVVETSEIIRRKDVRVCQQGKCPNYQKAE
jgi:hypothetical protein